MHKVVAVEWLRIRSLSRCGDGCYTQCSCISRGNLKYCVVKLLEEELRLRCTEKVIDSSFFFVFSIFFYQSLLLFPVTQFGLVPN